METIYDYATQAELASIGRTNKELHLKFSSEDSRNADLYLLFELRGDKKKAKEYLAKIKNVRYRDSISEPSDAIF